MWLRWASVLLLTGCTVDLDDYSRGVGKATCERAKACFHLDSTIDCDQPGVWSESRPELFLLAAGSVGYSAERAATCLGRIRNLGCSADAWQTDECQAAFPGRLNEGAPCGGFAEQEITASLSGEFSGSWPSRSPPKAL